MSKTDFTVGGGKHEKILSSSIESAFVLRMLKVRVEDLRGWVGLTDRANHVSRQPGHLAHQVRQSVPLHAQTDGN